MARFGQCRMDSGVHFDERPVQSTIIKPTHMRDFHIWLTNPFDDPHISLAELLSFTSDHLQRMINNPLAVLTSRIGPTTTALAAVAAAFGEDETKLGLRKAQVVLKNSYRHTLPEAVGKIALAVQAKFGEHSAEFVECFPHGRSIFTSSTDDKLAGELQTMINGVHAHVAQLTPQLETDATALLTGWTAVFNPSESSKGAKTSTMAAKATARAALQLELFRNLLMLAQNFPREPEQLDLYMQQSLLYPHTQSAPAPAPTPTPPTTEP